MNAAFTEPPPVELLAEQFLHDYHRYADYLFRRYMDWQPHCEIARRISASTSKPPASIRECWKLSGARSKSLSVTA